MRKPGNPEVVGNPGSNQARPRPINSSAHCMLSLEDATLPQNSTSWVCPPERNQFRNKPFAKLRSTPLDWYAAKEPSSRLAAATRAFPGPFRGLQSASSKNDIVEGGKSLEGTIFIDKHREFCVLGQRAHHRQLMHHEWRAPLNEDGKWCPVDKGGTLEPTNPITRPKMKNVPMEYLVCALQPQMENREREGRWRRSAARKR